MSLLINIQVLALSCCAGSGPHFSHVISHAHTHRLQAAVAVPCGCLYTSLSSWEWDCLENMSLVDARRLFSCQKILFTFHFYTAPQPHSGAFSSLLHFQKLVPPALAAFPLSISFSDSNQLADLRADSNKYTLAVVSTSSTLSCFREEMAFAGVWLSMHHMRLTDGVWLKRLYDLDLNFLPLLEVKQSWGSCRGH